MSAQQALEAVNSERLQQLLATLATFGPGEHGGMNRQALSEEDFAARAWLIEQARALGCEVFTDTCANLFIRRAGIKDLPPVMTGSHIDTQPTGGTLDGCYGVMAGLECLHALNASNIQTRRPIELVVWTNEEGSRFAPGAMGSSAYVEPGRVEQFRDNCDADGVSVGAALEAHARRFADLPLRGKIATHAFVELHIEQGPVLEQAGKDLGVVTGIQGVRWYQVRCKGASAHAGTTPMSMRRDAMLLAIETLQHIDALADRLSHAYDKRLTFGRWTVAPNAINTIANEVIFSLDFRHADAVVLQAFDTELASCLPEDAELECLFSHAPTSFDGEVVNVVEQACAATGRSHQPIRSGAFHDAMYLSGHCPTAMIFVPSRDGISHNPLEFTELAQLTTGAQALAWALIALAEQP